MLFFIQLALWLLSTRIGTFILCRKASLSSQFPYLHTFSQLSHQKREEIVLSWSLGFFSPLRMLFTALKVFTLLVFFTQVNEKDENLSWKAIGYCGPDPSTRKAKTSKKEKQYQKSSSSSEELFGPLYKGIINLKHPRQIVVETLRRSGFPVSVSRPSLVINCDAVVIGSGSGGGVIAGVLANAGHKVLVIEKGKYCARTNLSLLEGPSLDQMYLGNGIVTTDDLGILVLAGSTVGGGSAINWSASIPTPHHVLKEWSEYYELELFDSKLYREAMDIVCEKMGVQSDTKNEGFNNMVLRKGCHELGYHVESVPRNAQSDHYCGWCGFGCKDGRKKGTSETWLVDLVNSGNGAILPECEAIQVLHKQKEGRDRNSATGVAFEFQYEGVKEVCVVESKVTIVACGALSTPSLLKRSGLKNPNIGKNLHLHLATMAWGYFPDAAGLSNNITWPEADKKSYEGGIITAMSKVVGNFDGSGYGAVLQTPSLHPGLFSILMPWVSGNDIKKRMCKFSRTAHIFALARDKGSGELVSPNSISYHMDTADEESLKRGLEKILRILAAAGAEEIGTHHRKGKTLNVIQASSDEFERFVEEESSRALRDLSTPIVTAHQMGSCRMGVEPKGSVVNQMGEAWEVEGLFVADSSVFPTALGVNPMLTIQTIAYCTAKSVLEVLSRKKSSSTVGNI
uniref:Long-chain-alcohol oxidase n=1 Tax=Davidia involucrata TaxID=16924 RepID=A0A5B6Z7E6_DAVIN